MFIVRFEIEGENNNVIRSRVLLCHEVKISNHNFIGFNSTIIQKIKKEILIGVRTLVNKNPTNYSKNYGVLIKKISNHKELGIIIEE